MKKVELEAKFNAFYNDTYRNAMKYCLAKTGDFINSEDLLTDVYYAVYKIMMKEKSGEIENPEGYLFIALKNRIAKYWVKHRKEQLTTVSADEEVPFETLLDTDLALTEEKAMQKMLLQDIIEYVSAQPAPLRRAFIMHFYLGYTVEETADELNVPVSTARNYIYRLLKNVKETFCTD